MTKLVYQCTIELCTGWDGFCRLWNEVSDRWVLSATRMHEGIEKVPENIPLLGDMKFSWKKKTKEKQVLHLQYRYLFFKDLLRSISPMDTKKALSLDKQLKISKKVTCQWEQNLILDRALREQFSFFPN